MRALVLEAALLSLLLQLLGCASFLAQDEQIDASLTATPSEDLTDIPQASFLANASIPMRKLRRNGNGDSSTIGTCGTCDASRYPNLSPNQCVWPFGSTKSKKITLGCISQSIDDVCPSQEKKGLGSKMCIPIEEIPMTDIRDTKRKNPLFTGWLSQDFVLYKSSAARLPSGFSNRVYLDLGANHYKSSIENWFRKHYPGGDTFKVIAFEANKKFAATFQDHPEVEFHNMIVWTKNESIPWTWTGKENGFAGKDSKYMIQGIDIADFIQRRIKRDDYLVVKMDIEGAEYDIIPRLIETNTLPLIDEFFVEVHTDINTCCRGREDRKYSHAKELLQKVRNAGGYVHMWA
jgi:FkbM family methyltransferase